MVANSPSALLVTVNDGGGHIRYLTPAVRMGSRRADMLTLPQGCNQLVHGGSRQAHSLQHLFHAANQGMKILAATETRTSLLFLAACLRGQLERCGQSVHPRHSWGAEAGGREVRCRLHT